MSAPPLSLTVDSYGPTPCDFHQGMQVRFDLTVLGDPAVVSQVSVSIYIFDWAGDLFRHLQQDVTLDAKGVGHATLLWDGKDAMGFVTLPGREYGPTFEASARLPDRSRVTVNSQVCNGISSVPPGPPSSSSSRANPGPGSTSGPGSAPRSPSQPELGTDAASNEKTEPPPVNCDLTPWDPACWSKVYWWWPPKPPVPRPAILDGVDPGPGTGPPPVRGGGGGVIPPVRVDNPGDPPPAGPRPRSPRAVVVRPGSASGDGAPGSSCPIR